MIQIAEEPRFVVDCKAKPVVTVGHLRISRGGRRKEHKVASTFGSQGFQSHSVVFSVGKSGFPLIALLKSCTSTRPSTKVIGEINL